MKALTAGLALLVLATGEAQAYRLDGTALLYAGLNGAGYRAQAPVAAPVSGITVYPESAQPPLFEISYLEETGPALHSPVSTVLLHTRIPLKP